MVDPDVQVTENADQFMSHFTIGYCITSVGSALVLLYLLQAHPHWFIEYALSNPLLITLTMGTFAVFSGVITGMLFYIRSIDVTEAGDLE